MTSRQRLTLLGATGSIGASTLDVLARHPQRFELVAVTGHSRVAPMAALCSAHRPRWAVMSLPEGAEALRVSLRGTPGADTEVLCGPAALEQVACLDEVDVVMAAIVGAAGLPSALAAARAGKRVLLANKEALVMAGRVFLEAARVGGGLLLPVDSEHNAIMQCLPPDFAGDLRAAGVRRLVLTASGGPLRQWPLESLATVTPAQACAHPNWVMGRKISVDSATMMNKGLEVIEASWLFGARAGEIDVVIHPQSVIHSMVEYLDGSVIAQMGNPDMRTPIAHALGFPERIESGVRPLDFLSLGALSFEQPDRVRFPCLRLAYEALASGGTAPAILNAANEVAVARFLDGELSFTGIASLIEKVLERLPAAPVAQLNDVLAADRAARDLALGLGGGA